MKDIDFLKQYHKKRDFDRTSEPFGSDKRKDGQNIFVIQKHDASNVHFDFRLEVDGVLKSWAIPKGPSTDPRVKRLAIPTEDHPIEYADFEGTIPDDQYGGGTVMVWDAGTYKNLKEDDDRKSVPMQLKDGHITIWLSGKKLSGGYAIIRTGKGADERWLLVKIDDEEADARRNPVSTENKSVLSNRTMDKIEKDAKQRDDE